MSWVNIFGIAWSVSARQTTGSYYGQDSIFVGINRVIVDLMGFEGRRKSRNSSIDGSVLRNFTNSLDRWADTVLIVSCF